jgi:hypothetical protein
MGPVPEPPPPTPPIIPSLDQPTPPPPEEEAEDPQEDQVAKQAGQRAAKKTRMAFDSTKALADSGLLKLPPRTKRHKRTERVNNNGAAG